MTERSDWRIERPRDGSRVAKGVEAPARRLRGMR